MAAFDRLGLMPELCEATEDMGWTLPTEVQDEAIPLILGGGDVMIAAETGSGKTGAFALPILQLAHELLTGTAQAESDQESKVEVVSDRVCLNTLDRHQTVAISPDGLECQCREQYRWGGVRANKGVLSGKFYFEMEVTDEGLCRVGWATQRSVYELGTDRESYGYGGTGKKSFGRNFEDYGESFELKDVIGCGLDRESGQIWFSKNGKDLGKAYDIANNHKNKALFPAVVLKNAQVRMNFGGTSLKYMPAGYKAMEAIDKTCGVLASVQQKGASSSSSATPADISRLPLVVILEPTWELANQVYQEVAKFKSRLPAPAIEHELFIGGGPVKKMMAALKNGVQVVIGTPGRIVDLVKSNKMKLGAVRYFVLDEADRLLDTGNRKDIMAIYERFSKELPPQVVICSATLHSKEINSLAGQITSHAQWVDLKGKDSVPDTVDHAVIEIDPSTDTRWVSSARSSFVITDGVHRKDQCAVNNKSSESVSEAIKRLKPLVLLDVIEAFKMQQCLIFCRTQVDCDNLEAFMVKAGGGKRFRGRGTVAGVESPLSCVVLHSGRRRDERKDNLQAFKDGDVKFLICTDVAARGIDINQLPYVINMTLPHEAEEYIHRVGRVGRADSIGLAISLVAAGHHKEKVWWHNCKRKDRGRGCTNTKLTDRGGCTIWFDEPSVLRAVEQRLGGVELPRLNSQNLVQGREQFMAAAQSGQLNANPAAARSAQHVNALQSAVEELADLERQAQVDFLDLAGGHFK